MDITVKPLPQSKVEITVTLPWSEWEKEIDHAKDAMGKSLNLPGFRAGKVPGDVVLKRFGKQAILVEAQEHVVSHTYPKVLETKKIEAIGRPEVRVEKGEEGRPLTYIVTTAVLPEVKLSDWKKAVRTVNVEAKKNRETVTVTEKEVEDELTRLRGLRSVLREVDRPAKDGDSVIVDFTVVQNGVAIEGGTGKDHPIVLGSGAFIPGFETEVVGMKPGETKTFELTFPTEYHADHLAGKPAAFTVLLKKVNEKDLPALDDAFAKSLGAFETLAEFREHLKKNILAEKEDREKGARQTSIIEALISAANIEFPTVLLEAETDNMMREFKSRIEMMGMTFDAYLERLKKTESELRGEWEKEAKKRLSAGLVLEKVADELDITPSSEEVEQEMNEILMRFKSLSDAKKDVDLERVYSESQNRLRNRKVLEWLESHV